MVNVSSHCLFLLAIFATVISSRADADDSEARSVVDLFVRSCLSAEPDDLSSQLLDVGWQVEDRTIAARRRFRPLRSEHYPMLGGESELYDFAWYYQQRTPAPAQLGPKTDLQNRLNSSQRDHRGQVHLRLIEIDGHALTCELSYRPDPGSDGASSSFCRVLAEKGLGRCSDVPDSVIKSFEKKADFSHYAADVSYHGIYLAPPSSLVSQLSKQASTEDGADRHYLGVAFRRLGKAIQ